MLSKKNSLLIYLQSKLAERSFFYFATDSHIFCENISEKICEKFFCENFIKVLKIMQISSIIIYYLFVLRKIADLGDK